MSCSSYLNSFWDGENGCFVRCCFQNLETTRRTFVKFLQKARSRRYPVETDTDYINYADDLALLANTPTQAESLLYSLKQAAGSIGLCVNVNKTEYLWIKLEGVISILGGKPLKSVDKFIYFSSNILSTESEVDIRLVKAWAVINKLLIIRKSNLFDWIKRDFL